MRKPDVSFIRAERLSPELSDKEITIPPDLVVEVISPNETALDLDGKIGDYQSVGVPLIWVVNPNTRTVRVIRPDGSSPPPLTDEKTLTGEQRSARILLPRRGLPAAPHGRRAMKPTTAASDPDLAHEVPVRPIAPGTETAVHFECLADLDRSVADTV